jgi:peptide/nickel transport system substrate-binding protein
MRAEATWSDGEPITAKDVVFTYDLMLRPETGFPYSDYVALLDSVKAIEAYRVTFYFKRRHPLMLLQSGWSIIPEHVYRDHSADGTTLAAHPALRAPADNLVVSGPFRVSEWLPDERLVLERSESAYTGRSILDRVVFRFVPEATTRVVELQNGSVDVINPVPTSTLTSLAKDPRFQLAARGARFYDFIAWNGTRFAPFADPQVREALSLAIDRQAILEGMHVDAYATPAAGPYPPIFRHLYDTTVQPDPYAPDSARAILQRLGWVDADGDGILERGSQTLRFTLLTNSGSRGLMRSSAAEIIQAQLTRIGIAVDVRLLENSTLIDYVFSDTTRKFQAAIVGWRVALNPEYVRDQFWPRGAPYNITAYESDATDSLIPLALAARNAADAAAYWRAVARAIARDRPYAFLWFYDEVVGLNGRVKDARIDTYSVYQNLHHWRVEP